jgi:outer membrane protein assembly factor BamD (BamD/ComL family)
MLPMRVALPKQIVGGLVCLVLLAPGCSAFESRNAPRDPLAKLDPDEKPPTSLDQISDAVASLTGKGPNPERAQQQLASAQAAYDAAVRQQQRDPEAARGAFLEAAKMFGLAADKWPESAVAEEALFSQGESYFFADYYFDAEEAYGKLVKGFPRTRYLDMAQARRFAIAQYWLALHEADPQSFFSVNLTDEERPTRDVFGHAVRVLDNIRLDDPTGKLADDASLAIGNAYFARGKFLKADDYYTDLRKAFPSSEHQFRAHFLGLKSKLESYQGVEYSVKPLIEAEKILKQIQRQFPVEAKQEQSYLARAAGEIQFRKAEREWHRAARHYRRAEYGAARMYYQTLINEYASTPFAEKASERLRAIEGQPDVPRQPMEWLVDMFPEDDATPPIIANQPDAQRR